MIKIILASQSPRRQKLLAQIGLQFDVIPSACKEEITSTDPQIVVEELAYQKAADVAKKQVNALVIGADTMVVKDGKILGKPDSKAHAFELLSDLSGRAHYVYTGVALIRVNDNHEFISTYCFYEKTKVFFSALSSLEIQSYIASGSPMDKAGAYGIQDEWGAVFVEKIEGDFYNVVGLPLHRLYKELKTFEPGIFQP